MEESTENFSYVQYIMNVEYTKKKSKSIDRKPTIMILDTKLIDWNI